MRSIALCSEKGGVGKTTSVLNLAAVFAAKKLRVLVVDADPQGNASFVLLGGQRPRQPTLFDVLTCQAETDEAIVPTNIEGVSLIPADASLADATLALANEVGRERRLRLAMEEVEPDYDFVIVDTSPTRSLLTTNVLNCVRELYVPMSPALFGVLGLAQLQADVAQVRRFLDNRALRLAGIFLTMAEKNNVVRDLEDQLRALFGSIVMRTKIPRTIKLEAAHSRQESILAYAPKSPGAVAYRELAEEILSHVATKAERADHPERHHATDDAA